MKNAPARSATKKMLDLLTPLWRGLVPAALAASGAELAAVTLMATATWLITSAAHQPPIATLSVAIVLVRALALGRGLLRYLDRLVGHEAVLAALARMRARVYRASIPLAPAGSTTFRGGDLLTRFVGDVDAAQDLLLRCLIPAVTAGAVAVAAVAVSFALVPAAGIVLAAGLLAAGVAVPAATFAAWNRARGAHEEQGELAVRTVDLTAGAADLAAFGGAAEALERAAKVSASLAAAQRRRSRTTGVAGAAVVVLQGLTAIAVTVLALRSGAPGDPWNAVLTVVALASFEPVLALPESARRFADVSASARRLAAVLDEPPAVTEPAEPVRPPASPFPVELTGVRVRYRDDAPPALDGVDLRLPPGRRIAVVGASGSGKSTLLAVLMRFVEPSGGTVSVAGRPLAAHAGDDLRRLITGMTQHDHVFHARIKDNIGLAKPGCTHAELREVAGRARLLDWIESLPDGWDTVVGEHGAALSGGQRQRLLLARALLADPPVLLLDEPTEGLDSATADAVLADILDATRGRATVLVTHRPAGLAAVDEVVVLDNGRVVHRGTHRELLAHENYIGAVLA